MRKKQFDEFMLAIECLGEKLDKFNKIFAIYTATRISEVRNNFTVDLTNSLYDKLGVAIVRQERTKK